MSQEAVYSYDEQAVQIVDVAKNDDYTPVCKGVCATLGVIGASMALAFCKSAKARRIAKKQAKLMARRRRK